MNQAKIFSQGYRRYSGDRTGSIGAFRTLLGQSFRESLGIGRSARHKILPAIIIVMAYIPGVVFVGLAVLLPSELESFIPGYSEYYDYVIAVIYLFAGLVGPDLLCPDRRTGMLGVYLASPLSRQTYLAGKAAAILVLLSLVTLGPPLLMLFALSLQGDGPDGVQQWFATLGRIILSGSIIGLLYGSITVAISSMTDRKTIAAACVLVLIPGSNILVEVLVEEANFSTHLRSFDLIMLPRTLITRIYGEGTGWRTTENPTLLLWASLIGLLFLCLGYAWVAYKKMVVRR